MLGPYKSTFQCSTHFILAFIGNLKVTIMVLHGENYHGVREVMKVFLKNIAVQLKQYSKSLDKTSLLVDQPWALIDENYEMQRLIFKKDGELILSKNGKVTNGSWEYLAAANSLLIDRGEDKILCNEEFIDEGVMILKLDGTQNNFFALANENIVPDLNVEEYLLKIKKRKFHIKKHADQIKEFELENGNQLEIIKSESADKFSIHSDIYKKVLLNGIIPQDGEYQLKNSKNRLFIKAGKIEHLVTTIRYETKGGISIFIDQKNSPYYGYYQTGDMVYKDSERNQSLEDGKYRIGLIKKIEVSDGRID